MRLCCGASRATWSRTLTRSRRASTRSPSRVLACAITSRLDCIAFFFRVEGLEHGARSLFRASKRARSRTSCRTLARAISASTPTWKEKLSTPPASSYMHWPLTASKPCSSQARLLSHRLGRQRMFPERPSRRCIFEAHRVARELKSAGDQASRSAYLVPHVRCRACQELRPLPYPRVGLRYSGPGPRVASHLMPHAR